MPTPDDYLDAFRYTIGSAHFDGEQRRPPGTVTICDDLDNAFVDDGLRDGWLIDAGTAGPPRSFIVDRATLDLVDGPRRGELEHALMDALGSTSGLFVEARIDYPGSRPSAYRISEREPGTPDITSLP